jgi:hypothetical protein
VVVVVVMVMVTLCRWLSGPSAVGKDRSALSAGSRSTGRIIIVLFDLENEGAITLRKLADFSPNDAATHPRKLESLA